MNAQPVETGPARSSGPLAPPTPGQEGEIRLIGASRNYRRGQEIFAEADPADRVYKVVSGAVRAFRLLADGRRQICDFYLPGDVFGVELGARRRCAAEALCDTTLLIARPAALTTDPELGVRLCRLALRELQRSQDQVLTLGRRTASERVASFLVDLGKRLGAAAEFELPMSRNDMADYLGLTVETVSRVLTQLQSQHLIAIHDGRCVRLARPAALADCCG